MCGSACTKLYRQVLTATQLLALTTHEIFAWSDSTITLACLNEMPLKWTTFVANRVSDIQDIIAPSPEFLTHSKETWPTPPSIMMENPPEQRKPLSASVNAQAPTMIIDIERFSNHQRLPRSKALDFKFIQSLTTKVNVSLEPNDLTRAEVYLLRQAHHFQFTQGYILLQDGKPVPHCSHWIRSLMKIYV